MKKLCHYVLLVISVLGISMYVKSDEEWLPDVAAQFGFESWKGTTVSNYIKTVSTIDWSSLNIATNGMQISVSKTMGPNIFRLVICNDVDDVTVLRVDASIWNSVLSAQKGMLWWFAHMTTTVDYSSSTNNIPMTFKHLFILLTYVTLRNETTPELKSRVVSFSIVIHSTKLSFAACRHATFAPVVWCSSHNCTRFPSGDIPCGTRSAWRGWWWWASPWCGVPRPRLPKADGRG